MAKEISSLYLNLLQVVYLQANRQKVNIRT